MVQFVVEHSKTTKEEFCKLTWPEKVDFILLRLAGGSNRWCIHKNFMEFMAIYGEDCIKEDRQAGTNLASVLFTVAMQRLSKGAVLHENVNFCTQLPEKFWVYSSANDDYHIMTDDCVFFIKRGLPVAAKYAPTKDYALTIAWGLVEHIDQDGYGMDLNDPIIGKDLFFCAQRIIMEEEYTYDELFHRYAKPYQWRKHADWLWRYLSRSKKWDEFFKKIEIPGGLKGWKNRRQIKKELKEAYYSL